MEGSPPLSEGPREISNQEQGITVRGNDVQAIAVPGIAGKTALHKAAWKALTGDKWVLSTVSGLTIDFLSTPVMTRKPREYPMLDDEKALVDDELFL